MAQAYYGLDRGENEFDVTVGSSSTATTDVEVRVDIASSITKAEVLQALDNIRNAILKGNWTPY